MAFYLKNCRCYVGGELLRRNLMVDGADVRQAGAFLSDIPVYDGETKLIGPSFCDLHVHLREPGFSHKETVKSGTAAAARGGFTTVLAMPNLCPVPDTVEAMERQLALIEAGALIQVMPYAAVSAGEKGEALSEIEALAALCCGYSDDGKGVQSGALMEEAMKRIAAVGGLLAAHAEDERLLMPSGALHDGAAARRFGVPGMPPASEYRQILRDIELVRKTGCRYHVCHISAKESVDAVRQAKREGLPVTCEVTPHHLALSEEDISEDDGRFKMNPPLRGQADRAAILEGILDGTIDCIATDHAPHSREEKAGGLQKSAFGTVGSETAFAVCNTFLVKRGLIGYEKLFSLLAGRPREIIGKPVKPGWVLLDTEVRHTVNSGRFLSMGKSTPFEGMPLTGDVVMTAFDGGVVYENPALL